MNWRNIFVTHFTNEVFRVYGEIKSIYNNTNQCENINVAGKKCANSVTKKFFLRNKTENSQRKVLKDM